MLERLKIPLSLTMIGSLSVLVLLAACLSDVKATYSLTYCSQRLPNITAGQGGPEPDFPDNFHVFTERKLHSVRTIQSTQNVDQYYSKENGLAFLQQNSRSQSSRVWIYANTDELIKAPVNGACTDQLLDSTSASLFLDVLHSNGTVSLMDPKSALHWGEGTKKKVYAGLDYLGDRGIPVMKYQTCEYHDTRDATSFTTWMFVDPTKAVAPGRPKKMVLVAAIVEGTSTLNRSNPVNFKFRYDFTRYTIGVTPVDEHFELPEANLCGKRVNATAKHPLPKIPSDFYFKGEQITTYKDQSFPSIINRFDEGYFDDLSLSINRAEVSVNSDNINQRTFITSVSDFTTGLTYKVDMIRGTCDVTPISATSTSAKNIGNGKVRMRSPSGFFDLDSTSYQYMGVHRHHTRGIDCDVWTAQFSKPPPNDTFHLANSVYTWHFATSAWQTSNHYSTPYVMPVSLTVETQASTITMNMYEFTTNIQFQVPDVSLCFNASLTTPIRFILEGRYDQVVTPNPFKFRGAVRLAIAAVTLYTSVIRISELQFYPGQNGIVVECKLLDRRPQQGDVDSAVQQQTNLMAVQALQTSIKTDQFFFDVPIGAGKTTVRAKKDSFQLIGAGYNPPAVNPGRPTPKPITSRPGQPTSHPVVTPQWITVGPHYTYKPVTRAPYNPGNDKQPSSDASTGLSPGGTAGLIIGIIAALAIFGVVGFFLFKRHQEGGRSDQAITMSKLSEEE